MKRQHLWLVIAGLLLINFITVAFFLGKDDKGDKEVVATIGKEKITRQDWLNEMESRYGKEVLDEMVDQKVVAAAGNKYKVKISEKEIDRELKMMKTTYGTSASALSADEDKWREQIENSLILEELLTKDVNVPEEELNQYYEDHSSQFNLNDTYHISQIVVKTEKEAQQTEKELEQGSSFSALAMERSIDSFTAVQGGDLGYVNEENEQYSALIEEAKSLKAGKWSAPIQTEEGFAIVMLHEHVKGESYSFKEVKEQIRRQIAIEQMDIPVSTQPFKDEVEIKWFYDEAI
ncbi:peptidyl-prolyl cis-trans isomerase [Cytobacillus purgationiresistens]|uniref:peptidylprolyl isomerase n=1 Tax=Cytobacillus purgationiresistens TaxID=863449 RepID=A0ABU0ARM5_9BACI|nr:peptidyl-prolyl cis-trans isomerase [Cytobacillus purgationiresistens]MDQ0273078.1 foldase protein PrsA [Cytobacillus purgationiresistens]